MGQLNVWLNVNNSKTFAKNLKLTLIFLGFSH